MTTEKCLCGAEPIIEEKSLTDNNEIEKVYKYKCPNCKEKELPWLGQWHNGGALHEWNIIAKKRAYHKLMLEYNIIGICLSPPLISFKWKNKKKVWEKLTIDFFFDNFLYYYCFDYWYLNHGHSYKFGIGDKSFSSFKIAKEDAINNLIKLEKNLEKILEDIFMKNQVGR